ncbi:hypothetical protein VW41_04665 [Klebsiella michiganensis]|nr:hypothetical protein VW41_04665 [Klebsiella michiganensis]
MREDSAIYLISLLGKREKRQRRTLFIPSPFQEKGRRSSGERYLSPLPFRQKEKEAAENAIYPLSLPGRGLG